MPPPAAKRARGGAPAPTPASSTPASASAPAPAPAPSAPASAKARRAVPQTTAAFVDEVAAQPAQFLLARQADDGDAAAALVRAWAARFLQTTKELFDRGVRDGRETAVASQRAQTVLSELFVSGFDAEQVWAQLQLRHSALLKDLRRALAGIAFPAPTSARAEAKKDEEREADEEDGDEEEDDEDEDEEEEEEEEEEPPKRSKKSAKAPERASDSAYRRTVVDDQFFSLREMEAFADQMETLDSDEDDEPAPKRKRAATPSRTNDEGDENDDDDEKEDDDDDEDDEDGDDENVKKLTGIDIYRELPSDGSEEEEEEDEDEGEDEATARTKSGPDAGPTYADFYEPTRPGKRRAGVRKSATDDHDDEDDEEDDADEGEGDESEGEGDEEEGEGEEEEEDADADDEGKAATKRASLLDDDDAQDMAIDASDVVESRHAARLRQIRESIRKLEAESVGDKHWKLKGEASNKNRPANSLLEEHLEFERATKTVPVITEEVTRTLEDIIKARILDKLFDDVERRQAPAPEPKRRAGDGELNDEKSKKSLSEIYEEAYLREKERQAAPGTDGAAPASASGPSAPTAPTTTDAEDKEVKRIQGLMNELFRRLDQLTNFHYTPAEPTADVQVIANVPAIAVEEKVPASVSDAARLAPEEVYKKPTTIIAGASEMSVADRRRKREKGKKLRKDQAVKQAAKSMAGNPGLGNKYAKEATLAKLQNSSKNVVVAPTSASSSSSRTNYGSSSAVFKALQSAAGTPDDAKPARKARTTVSKPGVAMKL